MKLIRINQTRWKDAISSVAALSICGVILIQPNGALGQALEFKPRTLSEEEQQVCARGDALMMRSLKAQTTGDNVEGILQAIKTVMGEVGCLSPSQTCQILSEGVRAAVAPGGATPEVRRSVVGLFRELDCSLDRLTDLTREACAATTDNLKASMAVGQPFHLQVLELADLQMMHCPLTPILDAADGALLALETRSKGSVQ